MSNPGSWRRRAPADVLPRRVSWMIALVAALPSYAFGQGGSAPSAISANPFVQRGTTAPAIPLAVHPLDPVIDLLRQCSDRFATIRDYQCTFVKQELVGSSLTPVTCIEAKFREQPFSVYFRWMEPETGREAIFVQGENDDKILSHATGISKLFAGTVKVDPDSSLARKGNRHSIREAGIGNMIRKLITRWEFERQYQETEVFVGDGSLNGRSCLVITSVHPHADAGKFMFHTLKVYVDKELLLPVRMEGYAYPTEAGRQPGPLVESYTYVNLKVNAGLADIDFSPRNSAYEFSRL